MNLSHKIRKKPGKENKIKQNYLRNRCSGNHLNYKLNNRNCKLIFHRI